VNCRRSKSAIYCGTNKRPGQVGRGAPDSPASRTVWNEYQITRRGLSVIALEWLGKGRDGVIQPVQQDTFGSILFITRLDSCSWRSP
jgi:hypothetical protein